MTTAAFIAIWFVALNGTGYIAPQQVDLASAPCSFTGAVYGIAVDVPVNPRIAKWNNPKVAGLHCEVDISQRVTELPVGDYELATTVNTANRPFGETRPFDDYVGPDPHTSSKWLRSLRPPPATFGIGGSTSTQLPATRTLSWDAYPPEANVVGFIASKDGVDYPLTAATSQPVILTAYKTYRFTVRAVTATNEVSDPATLDYTFEQATPPTCGVIIRVDDWTHTVAIGDRGKVLLSLSSSFPITLLQVKLGAQVIGEVTGTDLRDLAGLFFSVPRTAGSYNITIAAKDSSCTALTTAPRVVIVQ